MQAYLSLQQLNNATRQDDDQPVSCHVADSHQEDKKALADPSNTAVRPSTPANAIITNRSCAPYSKIDVSVSVLRAAHLAVEKAGCKGVHPPFSTVGAAEGVC